MRTQVDVSRVYGPDYAPDYSQQRRRTPPPSPLQMADPIDDMENFIGVFKARVDSVIRPPARASCDSACTTSAPLVPCAAPEQPRSATRLRRRLRPFMARPVCACAATH